MKTPTLIAMMILALLTWVSVQDVRAQVDDGTGNQDNGGGGGGGYGGGGGGGGRRQQFNNQQGGGGGGGGGGYGGGGGQGYGGNGGGQGGGGGGRRNGGGQGFGGGNGGGGGQGFGGGGQGFNGGGQGFGGGGGQGFNGGGGRRGRRNFNDPNAGNFAPTSQPDDVQIPTPQAMAGTYLMLTSRSIFFRGRFVPDDAIQNGPPPTPREAFLVFNGAFITNNELEGFLENTDDGTVTPIHVGDQIAQGKISKITLDELDYTTGGRTMQLDIGQNLNGDQVYGATTQPVNIPVDASDIIKKMMARRAAELNAAMK